METDSSEAVNGRLFFLISWSEVTGCGKRGGGLQTKRTHLGASSPFNLKLNFNSGVNKSIEALRATRKFGTISLVADYAALTNQFLIGALMEKGITLRGAGQAPVQKYWKDLLKKVESGEFDETMILSHRFKINEFKELYVAFDKKEMGIMKSFVETRFSHPQAEGTPELSNLKAKDVKPSAVI